MLEYKLVFLIFSLPPLKMSPPIHMHTLGTIEVGRLLCHKFPHKPFLVECLLRHFFINIWVSLHPVFVFVEVEHRHFIIVICSNNIIVQVTIELDIVLFFILVISLADALWILFFVEVRVRSWGLIIS